MVLILILFSTAFAFAETVADRSVAVAAPVDPYSLPTKDCAVALRAETWRKRLADEKAAAANQNTTSPGGPALAPSNRAYAKVDASALPMTCKSGNLDSMRQALKNQLEECDRAAAKLDGKPAVSIQIACREFSRSEWCKETNTRMLALADKAKSFDEFMSNVKGEFDWYKSTGMPSDNGKFKKGDVQFTAYYAPPPIEASLKPTSEFKYPLYKQPPDLVEAGDGPGCGQDPVSTRRIKFCRKKADGSLEPYPDRQAIDRDKILAGKGLEIAYVKDPLDAWHLMLEGAGSIRLSSKEGSKIMRVNTGAQNGRPWISLSNIIKCENRGVGVWTEEKIREFLASYPPEKVLELLAIDSSYIFFETQNPQLLGINNIPLTGRHSFATDRKLIPTGAVTLFNTARPGGAAGKCDNVSSMAVAQDVGGAIVGHHIDWYVGEGEVAGKEATINSPGSVFVAMKRGAGKPVEGCTLEDSPKAN